MGVSLQRDSILDEPDFSGSIQLWVYSETMDGGENPYRPDLTMLGGQGGVGTNPPLRRQAFLLSFCLNDIPRLEFLRPSFQAFWIFQMSGHELLPAGHSQETCP